MYFRTWNRLNFEKNLKSNFWRSLRANIKKPNNKNCVKTTTNLRWLNIESFQFRVFHRLEGSMVLLGSFTFYIKLTHIFNSKELFYDFLPSSFTASLPWFSFVNTKNRVVINICTEIYYLIWNLLTSIVNLKLKQNKILRKIQPWEFIRLHARSCWEIKDQKALRHFSELVK